MRAKTRRQIQIAGLIVVVVGVLGGFLTVSSYKGIQAPNQAEHYLTIETQQLSPLAVKVFTENLSNRITILNSLYYEEKYAEADKEIATIMQLFARLKKDGYEAAEAHGYPTVRLWLEAEEHRMKQALTKRYDELVKPLADYKTHDRKDIDSFISSVGRHWEMQQRFERDSPRIDRSRAKHVSGHFRLAYEGEESPCFGAGSKDQTRRTIMEPLERNIGKLAALPRLRHLPYGPIEERATSVSLIVTLRMVDAENSKLSCRFHSHIHEKTNWPGKYRNGWNAKWVGYASDFKKNEDGERSAFGWTGGDEVYHHKTSLMAEELEKAFPHFVAY